MRSDAANGGRRQQPRQERRSVVEPKKPVILLWKMRERLRGRGLGLER